MSRGGGVTLVDGIAVAFWLSEGTGPTARTLVAGLDARGLGRATTCLGRPAGDRMAEGRAGGLPDGCTADPDADGIPFATAVAMLERAAAEGDDAMSAPAFLERLDPEAVRHARDSAMARLIGDLWWGVDAGMGRGAPLLAGLLAWPHLASVVSALWEADADAWCDAMRADGGARAVADGIAGHRTVAAMAGGLRDASDAYGRLVASSPNPGVARPARARDRLAAWLGTAASMPGEWVPRGAGEWDAFLGCAPVVDRAARWVSGDDMPAFLGARGRWREWEGRVRAAAGRVAPVEAMVDMIDPAGNLAREVLLPALELSGHRCPEGPERLEAVLTAWSLLYSGRTLPTCLALSRRLHETRAAVRARIRVAPGMPTGWPAGLPGMAVGDLSIRILTTSSGLVDEGAGGPDREGVAGLSHCVGDHAPECLEGASRIGSIRRVSASGTVRLSTVQFSVSGDGLGVVQHRGHGNADPPPEADALLDLYLRWVMGPSAPALDRSAFAPVPGIGAHRDGAGYDWSAPGEWERVAAAWSPSLPGPLRGLGRVAWAALAARAWRSRGKPGWAPEPWLPRR